MTLYELMNEYAMANPSQPNQECKTPELGQNLSFFHSSLIECDLDNEELEPEREEPIKKYAAVDEERFVLLEEFLGVFPAPSPAILF